MDQINHGDISFTGTEWWLFERIIIIDDIAIATPVLLLLRRDKTTEQHIILILRILKISILVQLDRNLASVSVSYSDGNSYTL